MTEEAAIESPCVRDCRVDQITGFCVGCFRTLTEISYWASYTNEQRRRIMNFIEARRAGLAGRDTAN
ncbi:hypothetical protein D3C83_65240 [compost metagenome]